MILDLMEIKNIDDKYNLVRENVKLIFGNENHILALDKIAGLNIMRSEFRKAKSTEKKEKLTYEMMKLKKHIIELLNKKI